MRRYFASYTLITLGMLMLTGCDGCGSVVRHARECDFRWQGSVTLSKGRETTRITGEGVERVYAPPNAWSGAPLGQGQAAALQSLLSLPQVQNARKEGWKVVGQSIIDWDMQCRRAEEPKDRRVERQRKTPDRGRPSADTDQSPLDRRRQSPAPFSLDFYTQALQSIDKVAGQGEAELVPGVFDTVIDGVPVKWRFANGQSAEFNFTCQNGSLQEGRLAFRQGGRSSSTVGILVGNPPLFEGEISEIQLGANSIAFGGELRPSEQNRNGPRSIPSRAGGSQDSVQLLGERWPVKSVVFRSRNGQSPLTIRFKSPFGLPNGAINVSNGTTIQLDQAAYEFASGEMSLAWLPFNLMQNGRATSVQRGETSMQLRSGIRQNMAITGR